MSETQPPPHVWIPDPKLNKHLKPDPIIPGQEFCVMAFAMPEDLATKRELFLVDNFLHEVSNEYIKATSQHMSRAINAQLKKKFDIQVDRYRNSKDEYHRLMADEMDKIRREEIQINEDEFATECLHEHFQGLEDLKAKFEDFKIRRRPQLDPQFNAKNGNKNSVRGVKFGGAFSTKEEAAERAEYLTSLEGYVHRFVPMSFHWIEFDPDPNACPEQRTGHAQLDEILRTRKEEQKKIDKHFQEETRSRIDEGRRENEQRKSLQKKYAPPQTIPTNIIPNSAQSQSSQESYGLPIPESDDSTSNTSGYQPPETQAVGVGNFTAEQIIANARQQSADIQRRMQTKYQTKTSKKSKKSKK